MRVSARTKIMTTILVLLVIASVFISIPVEANGRYCTDKTNFQITRRWSYLNSVSCNMTITSNGVARIDAIAAANPQNTTSVDISATLQRKNTRGNWIYVKSFSANGKASASLYEEYSLSYRGEYRVIVTATANNSETTSITKYAEY